MKRILFVLVLALLTVTLLTAASSLPNTTITLLQGLPAQMNVGEVQTVKVEVVAEQPFLSAQAMPSFAYPGKGVVAVQGGDRAGGGTSAVLEVTFQAKSSTARMEGGVAPVHVVVGVRYPGGQTAVQDFVFYVKVP